MFPNFANASTKWLLLSSDNGKKLHIAESPQLKFGTYNIVSNKDGGEIISYIVKISQNDKSHVCGMASYCPLSKEEGSVSLALITKENNYSNQEKKELEFKKPQGIIKKAHEYVCDKYYDSLIKYNTYIESANKHIEMQEFKNALSAYKLAYEEANSLAQLDYSENRVAEVLTFMAELCEENNKPSLAREYYQKIVNLTDLKDLSYKNKAEAKINSIPKTKSEKAKEVAKGVGAVGATGALMLLNAVVGN